MAARPYKNSEFLVALVRLNDRIARAITEQARGTWNPYFNSANCHSYARDVAAELGEIVEEIKKRSIEGSRARIPPIELPPKPD